jgi:hypothetical protein
MPFSKDPYKLLDEAAIANEPVIVLRAKVKLAPQALRIYAYQAKHADCDSTFVEELYAMAATMEHWQEQNKYRIKLPD